MGTNRSGTRRKQKQRRTKKMLERLAKKATTETKTAQPVAAK